MKSEMFMLGSRVWPGLSKLVEEAGEVQQVAGKLMGIGGKPDHWDGTNLRVRMGEEVADLSAACRAFFVLNGFDGAPWVLEREKIKYNLFLKWHVDNLEDKPEGIGVPEKRSWWRKFIGDGSDLHYQIYWAVRVYPSALRHTMAVFFMLGFVVATILAFVMGKLA